MGKPSDRCGINVSVLIKFFDRDDLSDLFVLSHDNKSAVTVRNIEFSVLYQDISVLEFKVQSPESAR